MQKHIVITGASQGIGKSIAARFAAAGHTLFLCSRNEAKLSQSALEIQALYPASKIKIRAADLSIKEQARDFGDWVLHHAVPDILINNAGSFKPGNYMEEPDGLLEEMIHNNLYSAYYLSRKLIPAMSTRNSGHVFNICSIASLAAYDGGGSYGISKFALDGFTQNLRHELKPQGIKVTGVYPGAVFTDSWKGFDNSQNRIMVPEDVSEMIYAATCLSPQAVVESIVLRPQLGDL